MPWEGFGQYQVLLSVRQLPDLAHEIQTFHCEINPKNFQRNFGSSQIDYEVIAEATLPTLPAQKHRPWHWPRCPLDTDRSFQNER